MSGHLNVKKNGVYYMKYNYYFNKYLAEFIILSDEHENIFSDTPNLLELYNNE